MVRWLPGVRVLFGGALLHTWVPVLWWDSRSRFFLHRPCTLLPSRAVSASALLLSSWTGPLMPSPVSFLHDKKERHTLKKKTKLRKANGVPYLGTVYPVIQSGEEFQGLWKPRPTQEKCIIYKAVMLTHDLSDFLPMESYLLQNGDLCSVRKTNSTTS